MRHGEAGVGGTDSCRSLSRKGLEQTAGVVSAWLQRKPTIQVAYRSPQMRASQTTDELTSQFPELHFKVSHWLLLPTNPESMLQKLEKFVSCRSLISFLRLLRSQPGCCLWDIILCLVLSGPYCRVKALDIRC